MKRFAVEMSWVVLAALACLSLAACGMPHPRAPEPDAATTVLPPWHPRPGHERPLIAIVGSNRGTELSDLLVPFGILSRDPGLQVEAVAANDGVLATFTDMGAPGPRLRMQATIASFDAQHPQGADVVVVPALASEASLVDWLRQQAAKGATLVSICNGALVVAQTGLFAGRSATAHWSTEDERHRRYPAVHWVRDRRYVADGGWISTTGVSAAVPASLALIEAIDGRPEAERIAQDLGVSDWSPRHDTNAYKPHLSGTAWPLAAVAYTNRWFHHRDAIRIHADEGVDEVSLALTLDAYASTGRSLAFVDTGTATAVTTRHGLTLLADTPPPMRDTATITPPTAHPATALDTALDGIMRRYGQATAKGVALVFEYPKPDHP